MLLMQIQEIHYGRIKMSQILLSIPKVMPMTAVYSLEALTVAQSWHLMLKRVLCSGEAWCSSPDGRFVQA